MESTTNLPYHHHHLQDQLPPSSSPSLPIPSCVALGSSHLWTPNISLNTCNFSPIRDSGQKSSNSPAISPINSTSMVQDLGFQWNGTNSMSFFNQSFHGNHDQNTDKIKEELSAESLPKFTQMLNGTSTENEAFPFPSTKNNNVPPPEYLNDLSHKLLIKTLISSGYQINGVQMKASDFYGSATSRNIGHFSQIYPSINVSNWNLSNTPSFSNSLDLNLQSPADIMVASTRSDAGNFGNSQDISMHKEILPYSLQDHQMQRISCNIPSKTSEATEAKRPCNSMEMRVNQTHPPKKTRVEPRASCPPFKVRKEKLGDRIAALQQLVAPFGKTDTASVLMEAIGYIKFLQNQVETLSVPYMKPSSNKTSKPAHRSSVEDDIEEKNRDLRSRGLCLVPLGCLSYVTGDGFNGGTS